MRKKGLTGAAVLVFLTAAACTGSPTGTGSVAMMPFFDQDQGVQGVVPHACRRNAPGNYDCAGLVPGGSPAVLVQQVVRASRDGTTAAVLERAGLSALPEPTGTVHGRAFEWEVYAFEATLADTGLLPVRIDLAMAGGDASSYLVALVTLPDTYEAQAPLWETVFYHAVYALEPLD